MREKPPARTDQPPGREPMPPENRFAIAFGVITLVAGIVVLAVASGTGATIAAAMLFGLAGIAFVSLIFLIIGQG
jgi:hypothetical protein